MHQERLEALIRGEATEVAGGQGVMELVFDGVTMACLSDAAHNRMRIIAPVVAVSDMTTAPGRESWRRISTPPSTPGTPPAGLSRMPPSSPPRIAQRTRTALRAPTDRAAGQDLRQQLSDR